MTARRGAMTAILAAMIAGCASVPEREFRGDYQPIWSVGVESGPGVSHRVYDLPKQSRLMVSRSFGTQFNASFSALSLLGLSDAKPGLDEMRHAAERFLAGHRPGCRIVDAAKSATSSDYEFRYSCAAPAQN
jgi:hypothetical protein